MSNPYNQNGVSSASQMSALNYSYNFSLTKALKKTWKYTNDLDSSANNQGIYACMVCTKSDFSSNNPDSNNYTLGTANFMTKLVYEDA